MHDAENVRKVLAKMGKNELIEHALSLHAITDNLDDIAVTYAQQIGHLCRVLTRSSRVVDGVLWSVRFTVDEVQVATDVTEKNWEKDKIFRELKTVLLSKSSISQLEFIDERTEVEEVVEEKSEIDETLGDIEEMLRAQNSG